MQRAEPFAGAGLDAGAMRSKRAAEFAEWKAKRIDARKKDEVAEFLLGFGLTPEEAEDVIQAVGVKPVKTKPHRRQAETV